MGSFDRKTQASFLHQKDKLVGFYSMEAFPRLTSFIPPVWEKSFQSPTKLKDTCSTVAKMKIPFMELSTLADDIHVKTREASKNAHCDMG